MNSRPQSSLRCCGDGSRSGSGPACRCQPDDGSAVEGTLGSVHRCTLPSCCGHRPELHRPTCGQSGSRHVVGGSLRAAGRRSAGRGVVGAGVLIRRSCAGSAVAGRTVPTIRSATSCPSGLVLLPVASHVPCFARCQRCAGRAAGRPAFHRGGLPPLNIQARPRLGGRSAAAHSGLPTSTDASLLGTIATRFFLVGKM